MELPIFWNLLFLEVDNTVKINILSELPNLDKYCDSVIRIIASVIYLKFKFYLGKGKKMLMRLFLSHHC
jgi:hypothetical protein